MSDWVEHALHITGLISLKVACSGDSRMPEGLNLKARRTSRITMLKKGICLSFSLSLFLVGCNPGAKPIAQSESYTWSVQDVAGENSTFVCKKVDIVIYASRKAGSNMDSTVVDDKYCAKLPKPQT